MDLKCINFKKIFIFLISLFFIPVCYAARLYNEAYYQNLWCSKWHGISEYKLSDNTRIDCLTTNYAVEFDFAKKWAESVGQALHYSLMTGKKPAIILIIEQPKDFIYYNRLKPLCRKYGIALWYMTSPVYENKINNNNRNILGWFPFKKIIQ